MICAYCDKEIDEKAGYVKDKDGNYYHLLCYEVKIGKISADDLK